MTPSYLSVKLPVWAVQVSSQPVSTHVNPLKMAPTATPQPPPPLPSAAMSAAHAQHKREYLEQLLGPSSQRCATYLLSP